MGSIFRAENDPPCRQALQQIHRGRQGGRSVSDAQPGKPPETAGRKVIGTKAFLRRYVSLAANYKGKPPETTGRKARGLKCAQTAQTMTARLLIIISKPLEMAGRKAMGAKVQI